MEHMPATAFGSTHCAQGPGLDVRSWAWDRAGGGEGWFRAQLSKLRWELGPSASHRCLSYMSLSSQAINQFSERVNLSSVEDIMLGL